MKLFVAVPAYESRISIETARALLNEQVFAAVSSIQMQIVFCPGGSLVTTVRDQIAKDFLNSDADKLVCIDWDVSWEPGSIVRLAKHPVDFVGGAYRHKQEPESYPVLFLDKEELWADPETGLLEVAALPAGFLCLTREVFERFRVTLPYRAYRHFDNELFGYYHAPPGGGEDGAFCNDWRGMDGKVWLDPELTLTHHNGPTAYRGHIGNWLKARAQ